MTELAAPREKRPTAARAFTFLIVLAVIGAGLTAFALSQRSAEGPKVPTDAPPPLVVTVEPAEVLPRFELSETYSGIAMASRESALGFTTGGRIERLAVDIGSRVRAGDVLATLDTRSLRAQLRAANAAVAEAEAAAEIAEATLRRQAILLEQGHISAQALDEVLARRDAAQARVQSAAAQADTLRVQIDLSTITAPFDGVITARHADEGVIAGPSQPILTLVESGPLEARIGVPAAIAPRLEPGETHTLMAGETPVTARLRSQTGIIDAQARTVTAIFEIMAGETVIAPGTVVRLAMSEMIEAPGVWVPVSALTEISRGVWSVLVAETDGGQTLARPRPVTLVHTDGRRAYVRGVLETGDLIILEGLQRVTPNQPVRPREATLAGRPATSGD